MSNTIVAQATAVGVSGLSVIRVSGTEAFAIADRCFRGRKPLVSAGSHTILYGTFFDGAVPLDNVTASVFRAPHSYTGEDTVEFGVHGGAVVPSEVVRVLQANGCALAGPGEFTRRAFVNGKLDLVQAEAVADLIHSISAPSAQISARQAVGRIAEQFTTLRDNLLDAAARIELEMDFYEEHPDLPSYSQTLWDGLLSSAMALCVQLLGSYQAADILRNGFICAIIGKPNAGKSTLFNALLGRERAIVSAVPGTTRDFISELLYINDIPIKLVDTAGLRATTDIVESQGMAYSMQLLAESHLILLVNPYSPSGDDYLDLYREISEQLAGKRVFIVQNKIDLYMRSFPDGATSGAIGGHLDMPQKTFYISATDATGRRLADLKASIGEVALQCLGICNDMLLNQRQAQKLAAIKQTLETIRELLEQDAPGEILSIELRNAGKMLDELTGRT